MKKDPRKASRATTLAELESVLDRFFDETKTPLGLALGRAPAISLSPPMPSVALPCSNKSLMDCAQGEAWTSTKSTRSFHG